VKSRVQFSGLWREKYGKEVSWITASEILNIKTSLSEFLHAGRSEVFRPPSGFNRVRTHLRKIRHSSMA
jgi:hypothetical protein